MPDESTLLAPSTLNKVLQKAIEAYDANELELRVVIDRQIKKLSPEKKQAKVQMQALLNKGFQLRQAETGLFYFTRGLPGGGSALDDLEQQLATKRAEQRSVFITYQWAQKDVAKKLQEALEKQGFMVIRDEEHLKYNTNLPRFMQIINDNNVDYVLPIISDHYLKSKNCMYEVEQILKRRGWEKRLLPYVITNGPADAKIYSGIGTHVTHWQAKRAQENNVQEQQVLDTILRSIEPFLNSIAKRINPSEAELVKDDYKALFEMIAEIEEEENGSKFKEIHELLRKAKFNVNLEEIIEAKADFEAAVAKIKSMNHVSGIEAISAQVYGAYGAFLLKQDNDQDKQRGEKFQRIANNFRNNNTNASLSSNNNNNASSASSSSASKATVLSSPQTTFNPDSSSSLASAAAPNVNPVDVAKFLKLVAEGEQDEAEKMLIANKDLVFACGDVTDLSNRNFKNITGFQYALWALDWNMWTMLQKYLPDEAAYQQIKAAKQGSWVSAHGADARVLVQNLENALQNCIGLYNQKKWDEGNRVWIQQVGGAQCLLPANVVNEYCHPTRSFNPCPNFTNVAVLPRSRRTDQGEWFTSKYANGTLGAAFAVQREQGRFAECVSLHKIHPYLQSRSWASGGYGGISLNFDAAAIRSFLSARISQHDKLIEELTKVQEQKFDSRLTY